MACLEGFDDVEVADAEFLEVGEEESEVGSFVGPSPRGVLGSEVEIDDLLTESGRDDGEVGSFDPKVLGSHVALGGEGERPEVREVLLEDGSESNGSSDSWIVVSFHLLPLDSKKEDAEMLDGRREDDVDLGGRKMDDRVPNVELNASEAGSDDGEIDGAGDMDVQDGLEVGKGSADGVEEGVERSTVVPRVKSLDQVAFPVGESELETHLRNGRRYFLRREVDDSRLLDVRKCDLVVDEGGCDLLKKENENRSARDHFVLTSSPSRHPPKPSFNQLHSLGSVVRSSRDTANRLAFQALLTRAALSKVSFHVRTAPPCCHPS